jgi:hypothetical protein
MKSDTLNEDTKDAEKKEFVDYNAVKEFAS